MVIKDGKIYQEIAYETVCNKIEYLRARKEEVQYNYDTQMADIEAELTALLCVDDEVRNPK